MTPLALERGAYKLPPLGSYLRLVVYAPEVLAPDPGMTFDRVMRSVRSLFARAVDDLRASRRWADVHLESGRTAGDRFEYVVLRPSAPAGQESLVGAVVVAPADAVEAGRFTVTADVSGEETGAIHFEPLRREVPLDGLHDAAMGGAAQVLRWLSQPAEDRE